MTDSMIKRMARAICCRDGCKAAVRDERYITQKPCDWIAYRDDARAALSALREPTEAMRQVGVDARWQSAVRDANNVREIWQAMIDAALKEQP